MNYFEYLKSCIDKSGLTLQEIADQLKEHGFNISKGYISQLQNGKTERPATDELNRALAAVLSVDPEKLLMASMIEKAPEEIKSKMLRLERLKEYKAEYDILSKFQVQESSATYSTEKTSVIPILGSIAAGVPIDQIENLEGVEYVDASYIRGKEAFALRVKGDSMIGDFIANGDVVICIAQVDVLPTDIAVVSVDRETATLKRAKFQGDMCVLFPSNPSTQPTLISADRVKIIGKVIEVRRRF